MLDHHIQRSIVYHLAFADHMRFSELQPDDIDSKLFTYHLKKVIAARLVTKTDDGQYALTAEGRRVGKGALKKQSRFIDRAYSVLFLVIRRESDGAWLLGKRLTHPLRDMVGFMHAQPVITEDVVTTAHNVCLAQTGLVGQFSVNGSGFFRIYTNDQLESFTHFTLLVCDDVLGELSLSQHASAEYSWVQAPDFDDPSMTPTAADLAALYADASLTFIEASFEL